MFVVGIGNYLQVFIAILFGEFVPDILNQGKRYTYNDE